MFCPRCSQQQLSSEVRFCSRCGFSLQAVAELLSGDGAHIANQTEIEKLRPALRKSEMRFGAKIVFLSLALGLPAGFAAALMLDWALPLLLAFIPLLFGLVQMLYVFIFGESLVRWKRNDESAALDAKETNYIFPEPQSVTTPLINSKSLNTAEMIQPLSVTDPTTHLLKNDLK